MGAEVPSQWKAPSVPRYPLKSSTGLCYKAMRALTTALQPPHSCVPTNMSTVTSHSKRCGFQDRLPC